MDEFYYKKGKYLHINNIIKITENCDRQCHQHVSYITVNTIQNRNNALSKDQGITKNMIEKQTCYNK